MWQEALDLAVSKVGHGCLSLSQHDAWPGLALGYRVS